jgi:hypothetical protein
MGFWGCGGRNSPDNQRDTGSPSLTTIALDGVQAPSNPVFPTPYTPHPAPTRNFLTQTLLTLIRVGRCGHLHSLHQIIEG